MRALKKVKLPWIFRALRAKDKALLEGKSATALVQNLV